MKITFFLLFTFFYINILTGQELNTSGGNSPAIIAQNFSITYGVRTDAVEAILWIYEAEGYDVERRKRATEQILREYTQSPEKQQIANELSAATRQKIGISDAPQVANALEWDLFAHSHYLSTNGYNSPAVIAKGNVNIWYGISPKALRALAIQLEGNKTDLTKFETQLSDQVKKYEELKTELKTYGSQEGVYRQADALLEEGMLDEAERLIESDFEGALKRQAYKGYIYGKTKELLLKYGEASKGYKNAVNNDEGNADYHLKYASNAHVLTNYDEAIQHLEIALGIDSLKNGNEEKIATILNNLGMVWMAKGKYDKAINYYEQALQIFLAVFGNSHAHVATLLNNLGGAWYSKGEYDKAINYFENALQIFNIDFKGNISNVAMGYNNLGLALGSKGEYDKAIDYFEQALSIDLKAFGKNHPNIAMRYNNLGSAWDSKGVHEKAIDYYEKALQIDQIVFGNQHLNVAREYNNLGGAWRSSGEFDKAFDYYEKALQITLVTLGESHPLIATMYNNLGAAWYSKAEYDRAIFYYEKGQVIFDQFYEPSHPDQTTNSLNLSRAAYWMGVRFCIEEKHEEALEYFQKALISAEKARNEGLFLACLNEIGSTQKHLKKYEAGLQSLNEGLDKSIQLNQKIDIFINEQMSQGMMENVEIRAKLTELRSLTLIRQMQFHKVGCLKGLNRNTEANALAKLLWQEGLKTNDDPLLEDLRKEGYDFGEN